MIDTHLRKRTSSMNQDLPRTTLRQFEPPIQLKHWQPWCKRAPLWKDWWILGCHFTCGTQTISLDLLSSWTLTEMLPQLCAFLLMWELILMTSEMSLAAILGSLRRSSRTCTLGWTTSHPSSLAGSRSSNWYVALQSGWAFLLPSSTLVLDSFKRLSVWSGKKLEIWRWELTITHKLWIPTC